MAQTTADLISSIKLRGSFPTANDLFSTTDYLTVLNDEMQNQVTPLLMKLNEEFFLTYQDTTVTLAQNAYRIPKRAIGSMLRDVQIINSSGNIYSLPRLFEEDKYSTTQGTMGYYLKSNQIILSPTPTASTDILRLAYFRRPSRFVITTACALVTSITGTTIVVSSLPTTMTAGILIDFVQGSSPYDILQVDSSIVSVSGTTLTFAAVPADLAVGDYISIAGEACVPMIPEELLPLLVQASLCVLLSSKKDASVELELQKLEQMKQAIITMLDPRVKSNDKKINNSGSVLNTARRIW